MNRFKKLSFLVACLALGFEGPAIADDSYAKRCEEFRIKLQTLDCPAAFKATESFLNENRNFVLSFSQKLSKERRSVIAFNTALLSSSTAIGNCLWKHRQDKSKIDSMLNANTKFKTFQAAIDYWSRQSDFAVGAAEILLRHYEDATTAMSQVYPQ